MAVRGNDTNMQAILDYKTNDAVISRLASAWNNPACEYGQSIMLSSIFMNSSFQHEYKQINKALYIYLLGALKQLWIFPLERLASND